MLKVQFRLSPSDINSSDGKVIRAYNPAFKGMTALLRRKRLDDAKRIVNHSLQRIFMS